MGYKIRMFLTLGIHNIVKEIKKCKCNQQPVLYYIILPKSTCF